MYKVEISTKAEKHLELHKKSGNKVVNERIDRIFKELKVQPKIGIGKPERMKHKEGEVWSRRIDEKNRMAYEIKENIVTVTVVSAMGHYDDK